MFLEGFALRFKRWICGLLAACLLAAMAPGLSGAALAVAPYYITVDRTKDRKSVV